jgi:hypothetical protein
MIIEYKLTIREEERWPKGMQVAKFRYLSILDELQYLPEVYLSDRALHDSIKDSLESIVKSFSKVLLRKMCSLYGLSENELLTNYDLFERSLYRILGKTGQPIISRIKADMLTYAVMNGSEITATDILDPKLTVSYVLKDIHETETFAFVRSVPSSQHIAFLYTNEFAKNKILSEFFHPQIAENHEGPPLGLISIKRPKKLSAELFNISYDKLLNETSKVRAKERLAAWIGHVDSFNKSQRLPTRIAEEDATLWLKNGFSPDEDLQLEQMFSTYTCDNNMSILCAFDISTIAGSDINSMMRSIISAHDCVILDEPPVVYTRATRSIRNKKNHIAIKTEVSE